MVAASAAGRLIAAILLPCLAAYAAACQAPYDAQPGPLKVLAPGGQDAEFADGLTIAAGERVLLAGTARVTGGVTIRGTLFLASNTSSTLSADWVVVESGGTLQAGSAACPVPAGVTATIELRDGTEHPTAGRKALAVLAGGTLEVRRWAAGMQCWALFSQLPGPQPWPAPGQPLGSLVLNLSARHLPACPAPPPCV